MVAICNENYILAACLDDYLLVKININNGNFENLIEYSEFNSIVVSSSCCISIYENIVYIAISQPTSENKIKNIIIKLNIENKNDLNNGPIIDNSKSKQIFIFPVEHTKTTTTRDISCEVAQEKTTNEHKLICVYENIDDSIKIINLVSINFDMENFEQSRIVAQSSQENGFRLYKTTDYYLRLVLRKGVYDVYLNNNFEIISKSVNSNLKSYNSLKHLFSYNNNIVITFSVSFCYYNDGTKKQISILKIITIYNDYYSIYLYAHSFESHNKIYNYYNDTLDYLIITYQTNDVIRYITLSNNKDIYNINSLTSVIRIKSNEEINFNISSLIESSKYFGKLYIEQSTTILSSNSSETIIKKYPYDSLVFPIDKENQKVNIETNTSLWYEFIFSFEEKNDDYLRIFSLPKTKLSIHICAFQCGSCSTDYYICDTCRDSNYTTKSGSDDTNCYPINQVFEEYIYDPDTKHFEKCYSSCKFCSLRGSASSSINHNCLSCADGYIPSYEYLGNCYKKIETEDNIIINSVSDSIFNTFSFCSLSTKNHKISTTKECVTQCPETIPYNSYTCNYINFTEQEYGQNLEIQCSALLLNIF